MTKIFRHDSITLKSSVTEADFVCFMKDELLPYFSEHYKGPTRASRADIKGQTLLKGARAGKYLWITTWNGSAGSVVGAAFENARMIKFAATEEILKKLESFGKRATEQVFDEIKSVKVATNK